MRAQLVARGPDCVLAEGPAFMCSFGVVAEGGASGASVCLMPAMAACCLAPVALPGPACSSGPCRGGAGRAGAPDAGPGAGRVLPGGRGAAPAAANAGALGQRGARARPGRGALARPRRRAAQAVQAGQGAAADTRQRSLQPQGLRAGWRSRRIVSPTCDPPACPSSTGRAAPCLAHQHRSRQHTRVSALALAALRIPILGQPKSRVQPV